MLLVQYYLQIFHYHHLAFVQMNVTDVMVLYGVNLN